MADARTIRDSREQRACAALVRMLAGGSAHLGPKEILARFPQRLRGARLRGAPHTPWQLLEHLRIAQEDILRFSLDPEHVSPQWPAEFWPKPSAPPDERSWIKSVRAFLGDLEELQGIARDPRRDLFTPIPHAKPATLFGQLALAASHNSYHLAQLVLLRRILAAR